MTPIPAETFLQIMLLDTETRDDLLEFAGSTSLAQAVLIRLVDRATTQFQTTKAQVPA